MYNKKLAQQAIDWFPKYLRHTKGEWNNVRFELLSWQAEIVGKTFGTVKRNGKRQYKTVYAEVPKKNGKSELAAGIALRLLFADREPGAEIYSAASDRDQAAIVFNVAADMVRKDTRLAQRCKILDSTKRIVHNNGSLYRVLSAESYSKHGYNTHGLVFDELHTQKTRELWDTLTEMAGDARSQPLIFVITTAGYDKTSICFEVHEYAQRILDGSLVDDTFLPIIYAADPEAEKDDPEFWQKEEVWKKCNPSLGVTIDIQKVRDACKQAKEIPAKENNFKRLRLNIWTESQTRWIPSEKWKLTNHKVDAEKLKGRKCYGGLDLSTTYDISAYTLCFPPEEDEKYYQFLHWFFIPQVNMTRREIKDRVPYSNWIKKGFMIATPGDFIDYAFIEKEIINSSEIYDIKAIQLDGWNAQPTIANLRDNYGMVMIIVQQGYKSLSPISKDFEVKISANELAMDNNPVMKWMISCTDIMSDPAGNIKPIKPARDKVGKRIDGVISSVLALAGAVSNLEKDSVYKDRGVITI